MHCILKNELALQKCLKIGAIGPYFTNESNQQYATYIAIHSFSQLVGWLTLAKTIISELVS